MVKSFCCCCTAGCCCWICCCTSCCWYCCCCCCCDGISGVAGLDGLVVVTWIMQTRHNRIEHLKLIILKTTHDFFGGQNRNIKSMGRVCQWSVGLITMQCTVDYAKIKIAPSIDKGRILNSKLDFQKTQDWYTNVLHSAKMRLSMYKSFSFKSVFFFARLSVIAHGLMIYSWTAIFLWREMHWYISTELENLFAIKITVVRLEE